MFYIKDNTDGSHTFYWFDPESFFKEVREGNKEAFSLKVDEDTLDYYEDIYLNQFNGTEQLFIKEMVEDNVYDIGFILNGMDAYLEGDILMLSDSIKDEHDLFEYLYNKYVPEEDHECFEGNLSNLLDTLEEFKEDFHYYYSKVLNRYYQINL